MFLDMQIFIEKNERKQMESPNYHLHNIIQIHNNVTWDWQYSR
jgi:hypothetical protein